MSCRCSDPAEAEAGFTLFEVLVVLVLAGLLAGIAVGAGRPVSPATSARLTAAAIAAALRDARGEAIAGARPVAVVFDLANHRYRVGEAEWRAVAPAVALSLLTTRGETVSETSGRIRFAPDGSASGGRVTVQGGGRTVGVAVDWLTGRVAREDR